MNSKEEIVFSEASYEWSQLRFQDFKSVDAFNHIVHKISQKLKFREKEHSDLEKIEKTLSTMLPSERLITQQYREKRFTVYANLIRTLRQAEKDHELAVWNSQQRPPGTAPLPEIHVTQKTGRDGSSSHPRNQSGGKRKKFRKPRGDFNNKGKGISKPNNDKKTAYFKCGCHTHLAKKCRTPQHLVDLYLKSIRRGENIKGKKYEAHFISHMAETGTLDLAPNGAGPSGTKSMPQGETPLNDDKMVVEYESNDIFGDLH
ncbi:uncharacterized protein C2845_PM02G43700 [Panicum miliaceum]|uniref:CCHC-type domain-containing protein n=1 Tax=Panicum miliaceum TaxID=4540 RepID=A0A3L6SC32_PANMI|nr:uncharacterized protein C2845_PM02G43700 [Panicum miliaceum]